MDTNISKIMVYVSIGVCIVVLILIGVLCRQIFIEKVTHEAETKDSIKQMVINYLDKHELRYNAKKFNESDSIFYVAFQNGEYMRIIADQESERYRIEGNLDLENSIKSEEKAAVIEQINKYNSNAALVSSYLDDDGDIVFWLGHNCDDGAYSTECFEIDFMTVMNQVSKATPKLLNDAGITPPPVKD
ncbi:MAG: YbjN domain-containing protein [Paramuribaculum sp.]|nr:YbjN domain-containing protein [Paramuribaculum sp.]